MVSAFLTYLGLDVGDLTLQRTYRYLSLQEARTSFLLNRNLKKLWIERLPRLMNSEAAHLMRCLQQILKVFSKANEILAGISHPSVCSEVLLSGAGTAYILGLAEVYRVSKRLEEGMKVWKVENEAILHCLRKVDLAWNNLLSFLVFGHSALQMLNINLLEPCDERDSHLSASDLPPEPACGVCLTEVKHEPQVSSGNSGPVVYQGRCYHASCANFWLNCVDATLPGGT